MENQISLIINKFNHKLDSQAIEITNIKQSIPDQKKSLESKISQITSTIETIFENQRGLKDTIISKKKINFKKKAS